MRSPEGRNDETPLGPLATKIKGEGSKNLLAFSCGKAALWLYGKHFRGITLGHFLGKNSVTTRGISKEGKRPVLNLNITMKCGIIYLGFYPSFSRRSTSYCWLANAWNHETKKNHQHWLFLCALCCRCLCRGLGACGASVCHSFWPAPINSTTC